MQFLQELQDVVGANYFIMITLNQSADNVDPEIVNNQVRTDISYNSSGLGPQFVKPLLKFEGFKNKTVKRTTLTYSLFMAPSDVKDPSIPSELENHYLLERSIKIAEHHQVLSFNLLKQLQNGQAVSMTFDLIQKIDSESHKDN